MSENEKAAGARLKAALDVLSESKREYILGYAEGVKDGKKLTEAITEAAKANNDNADE